MQIPYKLGECPRKVFSMADPTDQKPTLQATIYFTSNSMTIYIPYIVEILYVLNLKSPDSCALPMH